jgi:hypothetical protein
MNGALLNPGGSASSANIADAGLYANELTCDLLAQPQATEAISPRGSRATAGQATAGGRLAALARRQPVSGDPPTEKEIPGLTGS